VETYIKEILKTVKGPVSLEVTGLREKEMFDQAKKIYKRFNPIADNVVIKIPINPVPHKSASFEGLRVTAHLSKKGIPVNSTLIMNPEQSLLASKAGARYISPFVGRIDDYLRHKMGWRLVKENPRKGEFTKTGYYPAKGIKDEKGRKVHDNGVVSGVGLIKKVMEINKRYSFKTEVIAASIRNSRQVYELAQTGVHIATIPFSVLKDMVTHHKTAEGVKKFSADVIPEYESLFE
jgi:transaldolase